MEVLFTGFGTRDTHGMYNSFTLMPDGWVYACHGYLEHLEGEGEGRPRGGDELGEHLPLPAGRHRGSRSTRAGR